MIDLIFNPAAFGATFVVVLALVCLSFLRSEENTGEARRASATHHVIAAALLLALVAVALTLVALGLLCVVVC